MTKLGASRTYIQTAQNHYLVGHFWAGLVGQAALSYGVGSETRRGAPFWATPNACTFLSPHTEPGTILVQLPGTVLQL